MTSERTKFHPSVILVHFIKGIRSWLFLLFIIAVNTDGMGIYQVLSLSAILIFVVLTSIYKYFTYTYEIKPQKLIVYKGIIKKKETEISYDRIQTIKQRQWFFFKPFKVIEILIETAGSTPGEAEASLTAVDISLIETIEQLRNHSRTNYNKDNESILSMVSFTLSNNQISLYALTDMTVFLIFGAAFSFLIEWIPDNVFTTAESWINNLQLVMGIVVFLIGIVGIVLLSLAKNFVLFYQFKAMLQEDTLSIEYGLFERKVQKIPLKKIQGIKVHKQILRNFFGMSSVELILMGGQEEEDGLTSKKVLLFPLIQTKIVYKMLAEFLPNIPITKPAIQSVTKGKLWYFWRWILIIGLPLMIGGWFIKQWLSLIIGIFIISSLLYQWAKSQIQGYTIQGNRILCLQQLQSLSTVQLFIAQKNVQSFNRSSTKWLIEKNRGHIQVCFKEGDSPAYFDLRFIKREDEQFIYKNFWNS